MKSVFNIFDDYTNKNSARPFKISLIKFVILDFGNNLANIKNNIEKVNTATKMIGIMTSPFSMKNILNPIRARITITNKIPRIRVP